MRRLLVGLGVGLVILASAMVLRAFSDAGEFTTLVPRFDGECVRLAGFVGAEDMTVDREARVVYAAGVDRRAEGARGAVWALSLDEPEGAQPVDITKGAPADFSPHGLDFHRDGEGVPRLFVINHASGGDRIDVFRVDDGRLSLERSLSDPLLVHANEVLALGPAEAFVTLDSAASGGAGQVLEALLRRRTGQVVHIDASGARVVADGLAFANGLALSGDGGTLYVAETMGRSLALYRRDPATNTLAFDRREFIGTGVDNILRDESGLLWIGAHPKLVSFLGHAGDADRRSPSQVIIIDPEAGEGDQVFLSDGTDVSGSSVAVADVAARRLLIGSVFEPFILSCRLPEVWRQSEVYPASRPLSRGE